MTDQRVSTKASASTAVIELLPHGGHHRSVMVHGEIDVSVAPQLREQLFTALLDDTGAVVVDLRDVSFIDSAGLGVLVNARQRARSTGVAFEVVLPEGSAKIPFQVTGLTTLLNTRPS